MLGVPDSQFGCCRKKKYLSSLLNQTPFLCYLAVTYSLHQLNYTIDSVTYKFSKNFSFSDVSFLPVTHPPIFASVFCSLFTPAFFFIVFYQPFPVSLHCHFYVPPSLKLRRFYPLEKSPRYLSNTELNRPQSLPRRDALEEINQPCWE
jgi:hypothetical protein